jgi:hypothetical protein
LERRQVKESVYVLLRIPSDRKTRFPICGQDLATQKLAHLDYRNGCGAAIYRVCPNEQADFDSAVCTC